MKEILIIPFLLALLFLGAMLYAADKNKNVKIRKVVAQEVVETENFELTPSVLVI